MVDLKDKKVGIVLSGGGAKGAYQIGMLRALEEAGLKKENLVLAGSSIGALVSLIYSCRGVDAAREMFYGLGSAMEMMKKNSKQEKEDHAGHEGTADIEAAGAAPGAAGDKLSRMLMQGMEQLLPDELLTKNQISVTVCCYSVHRKRPVYYDLKGLLPSHQRTLVIASSSIPGIAPAVRYNGDELVDGGMVPPGLTGAEPADKVPAAALKNAPIDVELIGYLTPYDKVSPDALHPAAKCIEIRPSRPLETKPHAGTLDFSKEKLAAHEALGYEDTKRILERM